MDYTLVAFIVLLVFPATLIALVGTAMVFGLLPGVCEWVKNAKV